jgi:hypothetical protein
MAKQFIDDGEKGFIVRKKINENFSELYYNDTLWLSGSNLSLNYLTKYGNANTLLNSIVYDNGTNVGIGTGSPTDRLHVAGGNIVGYSGATSLSAGVILRNGTPVAYTIDGRIVADTVNAPHKVIIGSATNHPLQIITNNTQRVWIDNSGILASGNLNVSGDVTISGNLSALGTTTQIDTKMYVTSAVSVINTGTGPALTIKQTGSNDIATFFDDNNVAMIIKDGGNVGIGTSSPTRRLNVFGTPTLNGDNRAIIGLMDNTSMNSGVGGGIDFGGIFNIAGTYAEWAGIKGIKENNVNGDYAGALAFMSRAMGNNTSERMRISSTGNVGIGTTSPSQRLHVTDGTTTGDVRIALGTGVNALEIIRNGASDNWIRSYGGEFLIDQQANNSLIFRTNATEKARITAAGNVGIGTTSPSTKLEISNSSTGGSSTWQGGTDFLKLFANNGDFSEQAIAFQETGTNVGAKIGVKNIGNGAYDIIFANRNNSSLTSTLTEKLRITNTGNVGIGTNIPSGVLDVNGNAYFNKGRIGGGNHVTIRGFQTNQNYGVLAFTTSGPSGTSDVNIATISGLITSHTVGSESGGFVFTTVNAGVASEKMRLDASGRLGIGTTSPQGRLDVNGGFTIIRPTNDDPAGGHSILIPRAGTDPYTNPSRLEIRLYETESIISNHWAGTGVVRNLTVATGGAYHYYNGTTGNIGIGTTSPNEKLTIVGNLSATGTGAIKTVNANTTSDDVLVLGANNVIEKRTLTLWNAGSSGLLGNGLTTNYITKYGTSNDLLNSQIFDNGTNVGIGTSSPSTRLHVSSTNIFGATIENTTVNPTNVADADNFTLFKNYYGNTQISNWQNVGMRIGSRTTANGGTGQIVFTTGNDTERMRLDASGNVGIGTSSPSQKLHVVDSANSDLNGTAWFGSTAGNANIRIDAASTGFFAYQTFSQGGTGRFELGISSTSSDFYINPNVQSGSTGASIYVKKSNGCVGIGTTAPDYELQVAGNLGIGRSVGIDNREIKFRGDNVAHFSIYGAESGESYLSIRNTSSTPSPGNVGTTLFAIHSNGNVAINTVNSNTTSNDVLVLGANNVIEKRSFVPSRTTSTIIANTGDDLVQLYNQAKLLTPNGSALSATNRATLLIMPGSYTISSAINVDTEFVDIIGMEHARQQPNVFIYGASDIVVTANNVRVIGISSTTNRIQTLGSGTSRFFQNCVASSSSFGFGNANPADGTYVGCYLAAGVSSGFGGGSSGVASGTFFDCRLLGSGGGFGQGGASGFFENCVSNGPSFGGGNQTAGGATGTFIRCRSNGTYTFGGGVINGLSSGRFVDCEGGAYSFGSPLVTGSAANLVGATGTFIRCIARGQRAFGFGSNVNAGGRIYNCIIDTNGDSNFATFGSGLRVRLSIDGGDTEINTN